IAVLFDPDRLAALPPDVALAIRQAVAAAFKPLFAAGLLFVAVTIAATLFLDPETLRSAAPPTIAQEAAETPQTVEAGRRVSHPDLSASTSCFSSFSRGQPLQPGLCRRPLSTVSLPSL